MILVDTSIWVDHFRKRQPHLAVLLTNENVLCHPFVIGELACGNLKNREETLTLLQALPAVKSATNLEVLAFIEANKLMGKGIGYIDAHLLASTILSHTSIWTIDVHLSRMANLLNVGHSLN